MANQVGYSLGIFCMVAGVNGLPDDEAMKSAYKRLFVYEKVFGALMWKTNDEGEPEPFYLSEPGLFATLKGFQTNCSPMTDAAWKKHFFHLVDTEVRL